MSHQHPHPSQISIPEIPKKLPEDVQTVADFLLSQESELKTRKGTLSGQKFDFFKGKHATNALMRPKYQTSKRAKTLPIDSVDTAMTIMLKLLQLGLIVKVTKEEGSKVLALSGERTFDLESYYIMLYQGNQFWTQLMGIGVLIVIFIGVLFPLWPPFMRQGVYYLSLLMIGFLGFLMVLGVFRWILYIGLILVLGRGGWLFPNLFADVGFFESFQPVWVWDVKKKKKAKKE